MTAAVVKSSSDAESPAQRTKRRLITRRSALLCLAVLLALGLALIGLERYRQRASQRLMLQFANWVKVEILDKNPVRYESTGGGQPDWFGDASAFVLLETPTGQPISVQIYVQSSPFSTRVHHIDLYAAGVTGKQFSKLSINQITELMTKPSGHTISLPVDAPERSLSIDLRKLLPEAFASEEKP